jgi:hypothetical protein
MVKHLNPGTEFSVIEEELFGKIGYPH